MATSRALVAIALAAVAAILLRLRFLDVPLNTDEAGYGQIARLWSRGFTLYGDVAWVDRPQGLLGLYRVAVDLGDDRAVRLLALAAAIVMLVGVAAAAWALAGPRAAVLGAWLIALLGPAPHLEGFTANGELLGGAVATVAAALALWWWRRRSLWLLAFAGLAAGLAPLVKQSAFDGAIVLAVAILAMAWQTRAWSRGLLHAGIAAAFLLLPWVLAAVAAARSAVGISGWWYAIYGYRAETESLLSGDIGFRAERLVRSVPPMLVDGLPLLVFGIVGLVILRRRRELLLPAVWLGACALGFLAGGLYHPHYWVQMLAPLAALGGVGLDDLLRRWPQPIRRVGLAVLVALPLLAALPIYLASTPELASLRSSNDERLIQAESMGAAIAAATDPDDPIQVLWANAAVYWHADRTPRTRYLWYRGIERIPGGREGVVEAFEGDAPPVAVAGYQPVDALDIDGRVQATLAERYELVGEVDGAPLWLLGER